MGAPAVSWCIRTWGPSLSESGEGLTPERTADQKPRRRLWPETHLGWPLLRSGLESPGSPAGSRGSWQPRLGDLITVPIIPTTHTTHPHILLDHIGCFCPKPHSALFKESESWDCGNQMEGAFSIPVVAEWKSGLEVKQPEITKDWACCRGSGDNIPQSEGWPLRGQRAGCWGGGCASNPSSWVGAGLSWGQTPS